MLDPAGSFSSFTTIHFDYFPRPMFSSRLHTASIVFCQTDINIVRLTKIDARVHAALDRINVEHDSLLTGRSRTAWSKRPRDSIGQFSRRKASSMIRMTSTSFGFGLAVT